MSTLKQVAELIKKDDDIIISNQEKQTDQLSTLNKNFNKFLLDWERRRGDRLEDERERNRRRPGVAGRTVAAGAAAASSGDGFGIGLGTALKGLVIGGAAVAAKKLANAISERVKTQRGLHLLEQKELKQKTAEAEKEARRLQKEQEAERKRRETIARKQYAEYRAEAKRLADLEKRRLGERIADMFNRRGVQNRMSLADAERVRADAQRARAAQTYGEYGESRRSSFIEAQRARFGQAYSAYGDSRRSSLIEAQRARVAQAYGAYGESRRSADEMIKAQLKLNESLNNIQNIRSEIKSTPANASTLELAALNLQRREDLVANQRTVSALNIDLNANTSKPGLPEPLPLKISPKTGTSTLLAPDADGTNISSIAKLDTVNTTGSVSRPKVLSVTDVIPSLQDVTSRVQLVEVVDEPKIKQQITDVERKHGVKINVTENGAIDIRNSGANGKKPGTFVPEDIRNKVMVDLTAPKPKANADVKGKIKTSIGLAGVVLEGVNVFSNAAYDMNAIARSPSVMDTAADQTRSVDRGEYTKYVLAHAGALPGETVDFGAFMLNQLTGTNLNPELGKRSKEGLLNVLPSSYGLGGVLPENIEFGPISQSVFRGSQTAQQTMSESVVAGLAILGNTITEGSLSAGLGKTLKDLKAEDLQNQIEQGRASANLYSSSNNLYSQPIYSAEQLALMKKQLGEEQTNAFIRSQGGGLNLLQMPQVTNVNNSSTVVMGESDNAADPSPYAKMIEN